MKTETYKLTPITHENNTIRYDKISSLISNFVMTKWNDGLSEVTVIINKFNHATIYIDTDSAEYIFKEIPHHVEDNNCVKLEVTRRVAEHDVFYTTTKRVFMYDKFWRELVKTIVDHDTVISILDDK